MNGLVGKLVVGPLTNFVIMEEWDTECKSQPEPVFTLLTTTPWPLKPKDLFLRYVKTVHGRNTAHRVREQLNSHHITNANFNSWKAESFQHMIDKLNNPLRTYCVIISK